MMQPTMTIEDKNNFSVLEDDFIYDEEENHAKML